MVRVLANLIIRFQNLRQFCSSGSVSARCYEGGNAAILTPRGPLARAREPRGSSVQQQGSRIFHELLHPNQELAGFRPVDDAVVVGEGDVIIGWARTHADRSFFERVRG